MINYEIGGKLKALKSNMIVAKGKEYSIISILYKDDGIWLELDVRPNHFMVNAEWAKDSYDYVPPAKECKTCDGFRKIYVPNSGRLDGHTSYNKPCPECTKPKQEEKPQPKFKAGDRVIYRGYDDWFDHGSIYTVKNGLRKGQLGLATRDTEIVVDYVLEDCELIQDPKFKIGDKVRILNGPSIYLHPGNIGKIGTVAEIDCTEAQFRINGIPDNGKNDFWYKENNLERLIPITEDNVKSLKSGDKLICVKDSVEFKLLEPYPSLLMSCKKRINTRDDWFKPELFYLYKYFMLVEPKETPRRTFGDFKGEIEISPDIWETVEGKPKDDKPKFTKGQKIRCVSSEGIQYMPHIRPGDIYTFNKYHLQLYGTGIKIEEFSDHVFNVSFFEPVEYVSFSKALEWLKEGYKMDCIHELLYKVKYIYLKNDCILSDTGNVMHFRQIDILADDFYWVEKPEGV